MNNNNNSSSSNQLTATSTVATSGAQQPQQNAQPTPQNAEQQVTQVEQNGASAAATQKQKETTPQNNDAQPSSNPKQEKEDLLKSVLAQKFQQSEMRSKIKQNSIETLHEFAKRMKLVERMQSSAFSMQNPHLECAKFKTHQELSSEKDKETVLNVLAAFLSTNQGKISACQIVGAKTFREMYTKKSSRSKSKRDKDRSEKQQAQPYQPSSQPPVNVQTAQQKSMSELQMQQMAHQQQIAQQAQQQMPLFRTDKNLPQIQLQQVPLNQNGQPVHPQMFLPPQQHGLSNGHPGFYNMMTQFPQGMLGPIPPPPMPGGIPLSMMGQRVMVNPQAIHQQQVQQQAVQQQPQPQKQNQNSSEQNSQGRPKNGQAQDCQFVSSCNQQQKAAMARASQQTASDQSTNASKAYQHQQNQQQNSLSAQIAIKQKHRLDMEQKVLSRQGFTYDNVSYPELMIAEVATRYSLDSFFQLQTGVKQVKVSQEEQERMRDRGWWRQPCFFDLVEHHHHHIQQQGRLHECVCQGKPPEAPSKESPELQDIDEADQDEFMDGTAANQNAAKPSQPQNSGFQHLQQFTCSMCFRKQHRACIYKNRRMKRYVCASCQLRNMDPLQFPIKTLLAPFVIHRVSDFTNEEDVRKPFALNSQQAIQRFTLSMGLAQHLSIHADYPTLNPGRLSIQVRCIQMSPTAPFMHAFPTFGHLKVNGQNHQYFKISPPPNDKKRHDKILDITRLIQAGQNELAMTHVQKVLRTGRDDDHFVAAVYLVRQIAPEQLLEWIVGSPKSSHGCQDVITIESQILKIKQIVNYKETADDFNPEEDDDCIQTDSLKIDLRCQITQMRLQNPVRGQWCEHFQCFDLETYVHGNSKPTSRKWICPVCPNDKPIMLFKDLFMRRLLEIAAKENYDEFKVEVNRQLQVIFGERKYRLTEDDIVEETLYYSMKASKKQQIANYSSMTQPQHLRPPPNSQIDGNNNPICISEENSSSAQHTLNIAAAQPQPMSVPVQQEIAQTFEPIQQTQINNQAYQTTLPASGGAKSFFES